MEKRISKEEVKREEGEILPFYSKCSSDKDLATLTDWVDSPPDILINFIYEIGKKPTVHCYDSDSLRQWLNIPDNRLALWKAKPGQILNPQGYGGAPDLNFKFVKLYTGEFVIDDETVESLRSGELKNVILMALPAGVRRIGNLQGLFTVSGHHGQDPGYPTYKLSYIADLPISYSNLEAELERERKEEISEEEIGEEGWINELVEAIEESMEEEPSEEEEISSEEEEFIPEAIPTEQMLAYQETMNEILPLTGHYYRRVIQFPDDYTTEDIFNMGIFALLEYLREQNQGDFAVQDLETGYLYDVSSQDLLGNPDWQSISEEQYLDYRDNRNRYSIVSNVYEEELLSAPEPMVPGTPVERYFRREIPRPYNFTVMDILNPDESYRDLVIGYLQEVGQGHFSVIDLQTGKLYDITEGENLPDISWEEISPEEYLEYRNNPDRYLSTLNL